MLALACRTGDDGPEPEGDIVEQGTQAIFDNVRVGVVSAFTSDAAVLSIFVEGGLSTRTERMTPGQELELTPGCLLTLVEAVPEKGSRRAYVRLKWSC